MTLGPLARTVLELLDRYENVGEYPDRTDVWDMAIRAASTAVSPRTTDTND